MEIEQPNTPSADLNAMQPYFDMVAAIMGGVSTMRKAGETYLPKFELELKGAYEDRRNHASLTNIFRDIVENLAQKPFSSEVTISEGPTAVQEFAEDVDGRGNNLHVFAGEVFFDGIANGITWVLVDHVKGLGEGASVAQERAAGVRPLWARYDAVSVLAAYTAQIGGREEFVHVRLKESETVRDGWKETTKERVRVLDREPIVGDGEKITAYGNPKWALYEKQTDKNGKEQWVIIDEGVFSIGVIPLVPIVTGRRIGNSWQIHPPMRDAAELQIEHYQQENNLKNVSTLSAFPMLSGNGVEPVIGEDGQPEPLIVGPGKVLYTGSNQGGGSATWTYIEPQATSLTFLKARLEATAKELRELGRQPLTAQSGNLTAITTAVAADKGNSAIEAWALGLKDALEYALTLTAMWLNESGEIAVQINTDFDLGLGDDATFKEVLEMYRDGAISREALIHEAKRRGIIDDDYDEDPEDFEDDSATAALLGQEETGEPGSEDAA